MKTSRIGITEFQNKVVIIENTSCWEWSGRRRSDGYGLTIDNCAAHRLAWQLFNGPIPQDLWVCHHCDNPPCCNPKHLFLGTVYDNNADMMKKGRHFHVLNEDEVKKIRLLYQIKAGSHRKLAKLFNISHGHVRDIIKRKKWTNL